jgi:hypothetical protein
MKTLTLGASALLCAGIVSTSAFATPIGAGLNTAAQASELVQQVGHRKHWNGRRHWHHRRHWRGHHHDNDWWGWPLGFGLSLGVPLYANRYYGYSDYGNDYGYSDYGNGHVEYCLNRYRSYDPGTNTFLGYDGLRHECIGPY